MKYDIIYPTSLEQIDPDNDNIDILVQTENGKANFINCQSKLIFALGKRKNERPRGQHQTPRVPDYKTRLLLGLSCPA